MKYSFDAVPASSKPCLDSFFSPHEVGGEEKKVCSAKRCKLCSKAAILCRAKPRQAEGTAK